MGRAGGLAGLGYYLVVTGKLTVDTPPAATTAVAPPRTMPASLRTAATVRADCGRQPGRDRTIGNGRLTAHLLSKSYRERQ
jgi:hypothetical protein